jgi:hypothetical protein
MSLKELREPSPFISSLFFLDMSVFHHTLSVMMCCLTTGPKAMGPLIHMLTSLKL